MTQNDIIQQRLNKLLFTKRWKETTIMFKKDIIQKRKIRLNNLKIKQRFYKKSINNNCISQLRILDIRKAKYQQNNEQLTNIVKYINNPKKFDMLFQSHIKQSAKAVNYKQKKYQLLERSKLRYKNQIEKIDTKIEKLTQRIEKDYIVLEKERRLYTNHKNKIEQFKLKYELS